MKSRCFVARVDEVFPIYKHEKSADGKSTVATMADNIDKVLIHGLSYVVAKDSVKKGEDVVVIRPGTKVDIKSSGSWLSFLKNGVVRKVRKVGVVSHGVVIPNADAVVMVAAKYDGQYPCNSIRAFSREALDEWLGLSRRYSHAEQKDLRELYEMIDLCEQEIAMIEEGE